MTIISLAIMYSGMMSAVHHLEIVVQGLSVPISYDIWSQPLQVQLKSTSVVLTHQLRILPLNSLKYMYSELHTPSNGHDLIHQLNLTPTTTIDYIPML